MIYFVDEDEKYAEEFSLPLHLRNFDVKTIGDADSALEVLETAKNVDLVVLDIMLATRDTGYSKFSAGDTDGFLKTGLLVIEYLSDARPDIFPRKFVVLSSAGKPSLVSEIARVCNEDGIEYLKKSDFQRPSELANRLIGIMENT